MADIKKEYVQSDAVKQAQAALQQQQAQKPGAYTSQWQQTLNDTINKIQNREKFSYDLNGDALYQQYKDRYVQQGQQAMMDTMGQAAAMTGGYGNSYAQSVGQQTYQGYLQGLNDKIPELYQLALDQYNQQGNDLMNQYSLLADRENTDYGRYRDQVGDYNTQLDMLYNQYNNERNFDYGQFRDTKSDAQWQAEFDEAKRQYDQQWAASQAKSSGGGSGSGGSGGTGYSAPEGWTKEQIMEFQRQAGITVDGIWGPESQAAYEGGTGEVTADDIIGALRASFPGGVVTDGQVWNRAVAMMEKYGGADALRSAGLSVKIPNTNSGHAVANQKYMIN